MSDTKSKIIQLGEDMIRIKGYNAFSYHDIAQNLGIKNAAVHYYYPAKENLGLSIMQQTLQQFDEMVEAMDRKNLNEWQKLEAFLNIYLKSKAEDKVCIVGSLSPDYYTLGNAMQQGLEQLIERILEWVSLVLEEGRKKNFFSFEGEAQTKALLIITNMLAGLQLSRVSKKIDFNNICKAVLADLQP